MIVRAKITDEIARWNPIEFIAKGKAYIGTYSHQLLKDTKKEFTGFLPLSMVPAK